MRVGARFRLHVFRRKSFAVFLLDLNFDRHAVAIPTGHVRRIKTRHQFRFDDDIFKNFVNGVADVNITVCIRWTIV